MQVFTWFNISVSVSVRANCPSPMLCRMVRVDLVQHENTSQIFVVGFLNVYSWQHWYNVNVHGWFVNTFILYTYKCASKLPLSDVVRSGGWSGRSQSRDSIQGID